MAVLLLFVIPLDSFPMEGKSDDDDGDNEEKPYFPARGKAHSAVFLFFPSPPFQCKKKCKWLKRQQRDSWTIIAHFYFLVKKGKIQVWRDFALPGGIQKVGPL